MKLNFNLREFLMKTVPFLEFRKKARAILRYVKNGQTVLLTYRGKPVARLEPVADRTPKRPDDPFYSLDQIADHKAESLANADIDQQIYGI
jgi:prevent-host-death family protein